MDLLRQQFARIQQQFAALSASQKMLATSLVAIMVMTLVWWAKFAGTAEMEPISSKSMSSEESADIQTRLSAANIPSAISGSTILVPSEHKLQAIALLTSEKMLPRDDGGGFEEVISHISAFESEATKQKMWNIALQQNLRQIICAMPGVQNCQVLIDPISVERVEGSVQPTAAVHVWMKPSRSGERKLADSIAYLISGSSAHMAKSNVHVVIDGKPFFQSDRGNDAIGSASDAIEEQASEESRNERKITQALQSYGNVIATVTVKIDVISRRTIEEQVTAVKSVEAKSEQNSTESSGPANGGGEPGASANTGAAIAPSVPAEKSSNTEEKSKVEMQNYPSKKTENTEKPPGQPTPVSAAVHIPRVYFVDFVKRQTSSVKDPDEKLVDAAFEAQRPKIVEAVMHAIGLENEKAISVDASPDAPPLMAAIAPESPGASITTSLTAHVKEIGLGALALVSLFMVSSMVKKQTPAPAIAMAQDSPEPQLLGSGELIAGEVGEGNPMLDGMELDEDSIKAQQMVEQVSTLVKENPDAAANLVKRWLNRS